jgi:hypothetical protein
MASEGGFAPYIDDEIVIKLFQLANKSLLSSVYEMFI